jgi:hypothetical protein
LVMCLVLVPKKDQKSKRGLCCQFQFLW